MKKLIILDRDGVINADSDDYIKSPSEWYPLPGSLEAIAALNAAGFLVVVATNQSGLARGFYDSSMLEKIHAKMHAALAVFGGTIDKVFYCPHGPHDNCLCRKPKPGLLHQISTAYGIALSDVFFVGDSLRDIDAARNVGATPILVLSGNGKQTLEKHAQNLQGVACYDDLSAFAKTLTSKILC